MESVFPGRVASRRLLAAGLLVGGLVGLVLARTPEAGVRLHHESLTADTGSRVPVLWIEPEPDPESDPEHAARGTALLTHGITASKETLRALGEALALAGYRCCLADLPAHGDSRALLTDAELDATYAACAEALGGAGSPPHIDLLVGHSFGAETGGRALAAGRVAASVFVAIGARPRPGEGAGRVVLVSGVQDEVLRPDEVRRHAATVGGEAELVPWCDHVLEPFHPGVIAATVAAAALGRAAPRTPRAGTWRLLGGALLATSLLGALTLLTRTRTPRPTGRRAAVAGAVIALGVALAGAAVLDGMAVSALPTPARLGLALPLVGVALWLSAGVGLLLRKIPRLAACPAGAAQGLIACGALLLTAAVALSGQRFLALVYGILTLLLMAGALLGALLERRMGAPWAGHAAFAVLVGFVAGVWFGGLLL